MIPNITVADVLETERFGLIYACLLFFGLGFCAPFKGTVFVVCWAVQCLLFCGIYMLLSVCPRFYNQKQQS